MMVLYRKIKYKANYLGVLSHSVDWATSIAEVERKKLKKVLNIKKMDIADDSLVKVVIRVNMKTLLNLIFSY